MKTTVKLIAVMSLLLVWTGAALSQEQNPGVNQEQIVPPPAAPPVAPPPGTNLGLNEAMRKRLADQILNNKDLNLNTLIQRLQQIRGKILNQPQAVRRPARAGAGGAAAAPGRGLGRQIPRPGVGRGLDQRPANRAGGRGRGQVYNRAGRGFGPGQGRGRGAGNPGQGLGPGQGQGRGAGNIGQGLGPGQSRGRGAGNPGQGLGPRQGRGRGAGNIGRGMGFGGVRGMTLRFRDGSCIDLRMGRGLGRRIIRNGPKTPEENVKEQLESLDKELLN